MTAPELPPLVKNVVQRLIRAFAPEKIVLFGSYAKGTVHENSDVDLLVIANILHDKAHYKHRAKQLTADCFPAIDVVFASGDEVASATVSQSAFLLSILEKGLQFIQNEGK